MKVRRVIPSLFLLTSAIAFLVELAPAQAPKAATKEAPKAAAKAAPKAAATQPANLGQLMKGVFYINANVIFAAQGTDPATVPPAKDSSVSTDALSSTYGKWEAVENAGLALAEGASLLTLPGRKCSNGKAAPTAKADWAGLVRAVREAGLLAYKAAQAKDQDKILDAADAMTTACSNCHDKYRETPTLAQRCV